MAIVTLKSNFTFTAEEIRDINELIVEDILKAPELQVIHTIYPNIVTDKHIGFLKEGGIVGLPMNMESCGDEVQDWTIPGVQKTWQPKWWIVFLEECWKDLEGTMAVYALNKGMDVGDLTNTDYMAIVVMVLSQAIRKMLWRFAWFGDTEAQNVSNGGLITDGIDPEHFVLFDGFWKQLEAAAPTGSPQRVAISANSLATTAAQMAGMTGALAYQTLSEMWMKAPLSLRAQRSTGVDQLPDRFIACTQTLADGYMIYLENSGRELESAYRNLTNGISALEFRGLPLYPVPLWDEMIAQYQNNGTTLHNPHRAVLTSRSNLALGVFSSTAFEEVDVWYEKKEDKNYMRARDKMDAKLLQENLFVLAE